MKLRFNRDYRLTIEAEGREFVIRPPLRIAFDATKSISGGLNKCTVQIYNLVAESRLQLVKDAEQRKRIPFKLEVGYENALESLFKGTVHIGTLSRQGTDFVNEIESLDGGFDFLNSFTSRTVKGKERAIDKTLQDMPNTRRGTIRKQPGLVRPKVMVGNSVRLIEKGLNEGETWYIDDETLYIIKDNEVIDTYIPVISAQTGLLNTPQRKNKRVTFDTLMNPSVKIGGKARLDSKTAPYLNGIYRVDQIVYKGDNYGQDWTQSITGFLAKRLTDL